MDLDLNKVIPTRAGDFGFKRSRARISNSETSREMRKLRISRVHTETSFLFHISSIAPLLVDFVFKSFPTKARDKKLPPRGHNFCLI